MNDDRAQLLAVFLAEADEQLALLDDELRKLEGDGATEDRIAALFRTAHTFKGNSSIVGFERLATLSHALEEVLDQIRRSVISIDDQLLADLHEAVDVLRVAVSLIRNGDDNIDRKWLSVFARLSATATRQQENSTSTTRSTRDTAVGGVSIAQPPTRRRVRVDVARLDRLLSLLADLIVARGEMNRLFATIPAKSPDQRALVELHRGQERLLHELQFELMQARLVPIGQLFDRLEPWLNDLAASLGKQVIFAVESSDILVDTAIIEQLRDPVMHILRNAVDHGIEQPTVRRARHKSETGTIIAHARQTADGIVIEISDDGAGLSRERIIERALELGITMPVEPTDAEVFDLIFRPGFSTVVEVSEISGRGVGMDIVRRAVIAQRGTIAVTSREGDGTRFVLTCPLTVALGPALLVRVLSHVVAVPIESVVASFRAPAAIPKNQVAFVYDKKALELIRMRALFGEEQRAHEEAVVIVRYGNRQGALVVDEIIGETPAVLRPLSGVRRGQSSFSGATILSDGTVALVLHLAHVLQGSK